MRSLDLRVAALLVVCAGCDQVFGLEHTSVQDGPKDFFDAPTDAPFACPTSADDTPVFSPLLHQVIQQPCRDYETSRASGYAMAICQDPSFNGFHVYRGLIDQPMSPVPDFDDASSDIQFLRLAPGGTEAWITYYSSAKTTYQIRRYDLDGATQTWLRGADYLDPPAYIAISSPTRAPDRRVLQTSTSDANLHELAEQPDGTWKEIDAYTPVDLGAQATVPMISGDGLRLVFVGGATASSSAQPYFTARASLTSRFRVATPLAGVPLSDDQHYFLTDDCSRVYFSGLQQILYVRRQ